MIEIPSHFKLNISNTLKKCNFLLGKKSPTHNPIYTIRRKTFQICLIIIFSSLYATLYGICKYAFKKEVNYLQLIYPKYSAPFYINAIPFTWIGTQTCLINIVPIILFGSFIVDCITFILVTISRWESHDFIYLQNVLKARNAIYKFILIVCFNFITLQYTLFKMWKIDDKALYELQIPAQSLYLESFNKPISYSITEYRNIVVISAWIQFFLNTTISLIILLADKSLIFSLNDIIFLINNTFGIGEFGHAIIFTDAGGIKSMVNNFYFYPISWIVVTLLIAFGINRYYIVEGKSLTYDVLTYRHAKLKRITDHTILHNQYSGQYLPIINYIFSKIYISRMLIVKLSYILGGFIFFYFNTLITMDINKLITLDKVTYSQKKKGYVLINWHRHALYITIFSYVFRFMINFSMFEWIGLLANNPLINMLLLSSPNPANMPISLVYNTVNIIRKFRSKIYDI